MDAALKEIYEVHERGYLGLLGKTGNSLDPHNGQRIEVPDLKDWTEFGQDENNPCLKPKGWVVFPPDDSTPALYFNVTNPDKYQPGCHCTITFAEARPHGVSYDIYVEID